MGGTGADQMSGRMMLARFAMGASFIGRAVFFISIVAAGGMMAFGVVATMCSTNTLAQELYNMIMYSTLLLTGAFLVLAICSALCWIITGLGDSVTFLFYLASRLGTFAIVMGFIIVVIIIDLRFVGGGCQAGSPSRIMLIGGGALATGLAIQLGSMALLGKYLDGGGKPAKEPMA